MAHMKDELLTLYRNFGTPWNTPDEAGMRDCADSECNFIHIGRHLQTGQGDWVLHQRGLPAHGHHLPRQNSGGVRQYRRSAHRL